MFAVIQSATDHKTRHIIEFSHIVEVTLKYCQIPERRIQFHHGATRRLYGPVFDTEHQAEQYLRLREQMDSLLVQVQKLRREADALVTEHIIRNRYRSNQPDRNNIRAYNEWRKQGEVEILTPQGERPCTST